MLRIYQSMSSEKIEIENINTPGKTNNVDKEKYLAMKSCLLKVIPKKKPGINQKDMLSKVKESADQKLWPKGEKSGWGAKTVQLDLEAKGVIERTNQKPLTWFRKN